MSFFFKNRELSIQLRDGSPKKMIKSAIFEPNLLYMNPKSMLLTISLFLLGLTVTAQYTEKINTNRPGTSQGAFSVGNNVLQLEGGFGFGKEKHKILDTKTNLFNFDYSVRYGLLIEQLEIILNGRFRSDGVTQTIGANEEKIKRSNFEFNTIGAKYLIYDPYKKPKENDSLELEKLKSWKKTYKFRWKSLIPAVSAYVGMNYVTSDNPFTFPTDKTISPKFVIATQNNWWTSNAGSWVLVTNLIIDKITTDIPTYGWIITSTHTIHDKWAIFGEYQGQKSDFYSDNILRLGGAYLFNNDLQIDANIATNFKDTPSVFTFSFGGSYRFDWHTKDEIIELPGFEGGIKDDEEENEEGIEKKEGEIDEIEEIENDSIKLEKTPFINEFEDSSLREDMEKDLDERRTAERLERERLEQEKVDKKNDKKLRKEERRRLKREAKEAKQAEKARVKAEKEKQKMIEDIDAELDKMEQDDSADDELKKIDEELKKLEEDLNLEPTKEEPKKSEKKKKKKKKKKKEKKESVQEEEDIDAAYDKLRKEEEKAKKEEEKRRKEDDKKRLKEEKKKKKEEEKRRKEEEKQRKKEEKNKGNDE